MAYTRDLIRLECQFGCSCELMPRDLKMELVVIDDLPLIQTESLRGIIFKFPRRWGIRSQRGSPNTLFELSFKVSAIIIENCIRRLYAVDPTRNIIEWHFLEFLMARTSLTGDFGIYPLDLQKHCFLDFLQDYYRYIPTHFRRKRVFAVIIKMIILKYIIICVVKIRVCLTTDS